MNLFDLPDDGRRSLEALRQRLEDLEEEELMQHQDFGRVDEGLKRHIAIAKEALAQAEREAMK